jgi:hypothetical protein
MGRCDSCRSAIDRVKCRTVVVPLLQGRQRDNIIEADHRTLKRMRGPTRVFQNMGSCEGVERARFADRRFEIAASLSLSSRQQ